MKREKTGSEEKKRKRRPMKKAFCPEEKGKEKNGCTPTQNWAEPAATEERGQRLKGGGGRGES